MNPAKEDEMDHLDLLALLGMRFRVAPAGCGYGYEAVRMCPFCKKGHLSQHELVEVPQSSPGSVYGITDSGFRAETEGDVENA